MREVAASRRSAAALSTRGLQPEAREPAGLVSAQPPPRLRVQPRHEVAEAQALHLGQAARAQDDPGQRSVVGAALPGLEVVCERERCAIAAVARLERGPEAVVRLLLD